MAISLVDWGPINTSGGNQNFQNSGGAVTPALPSGIQAGDLIVLFCGNNDGTNATGFTATGYTQVVTTGGTCRVSFLTKVASSGGESNPTVSTSGSGLTNDPSMVLVGVFRGVDTTAGVYLSNTRNTTVGTIFEYPALDYGGLPPAIGFEYDALTVVCSFRPNDYNQAPAGAGGYSIINTETALGSDSSIVAAYQIETGQAPSTLGQGDFGGTAAGGGTTGSTSVLALYQGAAVATKPPYFQVVLI